MANWIVGDVHGCFEPLMRLLQEINFDRKSDKLYFVGDLVDRGGHILETVAFVQKGMLEGWAECVLGNHEDMWIEAVNERAIEEHAQYYPCTYQQLGREGVVDLVIWARKLPVYIALDDVIIVHGGMELYNDFFSQSRDVHLWSRCLDVIPEELRYGKTIIHGHTPIDYPLLRKDRFNIDTGCGFGAYMKSKGIEDPYDLGEFEHFYKHGFYAGFDGKEMDVLFSGKYDNYTLGYEDGKKARNAVSDKYGKINYYYEMIGILQDPSTLVKVEN